MAETAGEERPLAAGPGGSRADSRKAAMTAIARILLYRSADSRLAHVEERRPLRFHHRLRPASIGGAPRRASQQRFGSRVVLNRSWPNQRRAGSRRPPPAFLLFSIYARPRSDLPIEGGYHGIEGGLKLSPPWPAAHRSMRPAGLPRFHRDHPNLPLKFRSGRVGQLSPATINDRCRIRCLSLVVPRDRGRVSTTPL